MKKCLSTNSKVLVLCLFVCHTLLTYYLVSEKCDCEKQCQKSKIVQSWINNDFKKNEPTFTHSMVLGNEMSNNNINDCTTIIEYLHNKNRKLAAKIKEMVFKIKNKYLSKLSLKLAEKYKAQPKPFKNINDISELRMERNANGLNPCELQQNNDKLPKTTIKIATYNIWNIMKPIMIRMNAIIDILIKNNIDIIALQEVRLLQFDNQGYRKKNINVHLFFFYCEFAQSNNKKKKEKIAKKDFENKINV